jgi:hypothetical protein
MATAGYRSWQLSASSGRDRAASQVGSAGSIPVTRSVTGDGHGVSRERDRADVLGAAKPRPPDLDVLIDHLR